MVDGQGNPVQGVTVVIGSANVVTGADGSFTFNSITTPYNVKLILTTGNASGFEYQGITTLTPQLYAVGLTPSPSSATLTVNFPALAAGQKATVVYTDNALVHSYTTIATSPATVNVTWQNSAPITGKVIVLIYTTDLTGAVTAYNKYGEKSNIALNNNGTASLTFAATDLNVTPTTTALTGSITAPAGFNPATTRMILKFTTQGTPLIGANIGTVAVGPTFSFNVPGGLTSAFSIGLEGLASSPAPTVQTSLKLITATVGGSNNINLETPPTLSTPVNMATGVDTTTNFGFGGGTGTGVYLIQISSSVPTPKNFYILTASTSVTIPSFSAYGLPMGSGVAYSWQVVKLGSMASVNDFVSSAVFNNSNFNFETLTQAWTFTSH